MADPRDELTELELRNIPRITVRPEAMAAPPPNDERTGQPWGAPDAQGRPAGRLFEPDQAPAPQPAPSPIPVFDRAVSGVRSAVLGPTEPNPPGVPWVRFDPSRLTETGRQISGGLGSLARGAGQYLFGSGITAPEPQPPRAAPDPTTGPRAMWQQQYPSQPSPLTRGIGHVAQELYRPIKEGFEGEVARMQPGVTSDVYQGGREQAIRGAADIGLNLMGTGTTFAAARPGSSLGLFGGRMSPKADQSAFDLADQMAARGMSDQQIFDATKLRRFADRKWRFEVSDEKARFKGLPDNYDLDKVTQQIFNERNPAQGLDLFGKKSGIKPPAPGTARYRLEMHESRKEALARIDKQPSLMWSDLVDHPEALEAFPYLKDMPVYINYNGSHRGAYFPPRTVNDKPFMEINPLQNVDANGALDPRGKMLEVLLHEPQHVIQQREGFARGANTTYIEPGGQLEKIFNEKVAELTRPMPRDEWDKVHRWKFGDQKHADDAYRYYVENHSVTPNERAQHENYVRGWLPKWAYPASAGENEANLPYLRRDLTAAQRAARDPQLDMKFPFEQQIVEFNKPLEQAKLGDTLNPVPREMRMQAKAKEKPGSPSVPSAVSARSGAVPEVGERYPLVVPPTQTYDPKTKVWFPQKTLSEEAQRVQKARVAAQRDIDAGNYTPYFDPAKRADVNPANYPEMVSTKDVVRPAKEKTRQKYEEMANTPEARARLDAAFERGMRQQAGSENWYFMKQLEDEFIKEYGAAKGSALFKERFADAMAATTGGADPTSNLMMAHYGNFLKARGEQVPPSHAFPFPIGGRYAGSNMEQFDKMIMQGQGISPTLNPKRYNFSGNFTGYGQGATIDEQMMGLIGAKDAKGKVLQMPPTGSYGHFEDVVHQGAAAKGVTPRYYQEVGWAGAKDEKTKGGFEAKPMIQIVNEAIERTHRITGMPRDEIVRRGLVRAEIPLYGVTGVLGGGAALGSIADPRGYQQ